jgi:hypothetical protein
MDWREGILLSYSANLSLKVLAYLLTLAGITLFAGGLHGFLFLLIPLGLDAWGALVIRDNHAAFQEDVLENLEAECLAACGITKGDLFYPFCEITGAIDHWMLRKLKADVRFSVMAPKQDAVVITDRKGRIFPLKRVFGKVAYHTEDAGTRDVFYADITAVELTGKALTMTTASGETVSYAGQGDKAAEAVAQLRDHLRDFKSRNARPSNGI